MEALYSLPTAPLCQQQNIVKQRFLNKSSQKFASVRPDSCAFYRAVINQRSLANEKEGHRMQESPRDLQMHNEEIERQKMISFSARAYVNIHKWNGG